MHFYIMRHGQRADEDSRTRKDNIGLSAIGQQQAEALAKWFAGRQLHAIYSSCMLRAIQTAQPLQRQTGLPLQVWPILCESSIDTWRKQIEKNPHRQPATVVWRDGSSWDDQEELNAKRLVDDYYLLADIPARFPECHLTQPFPYPQAWWKPLDGESRETGFARASLAAEALLARHRGDEYIAVICHGNFGDMLIRCLLGLERFQFRDFSMDETGVNWIEVTQTGLRFMHTINNLEHLPIHLQPEWRRPQQPAFITGQ